jgi:hypothetical protein
MKLLSIVACLPLLPLAPDATSSFDSLYFRFWTTFIQKLSNLYVPTFTSCLLTDDGSVCTSASPHLRVYKSSRHMHLSVRTKSHSPKQMMPAKCSWNSGLSAVSLEFKFNTFFMYKSSALKSSIQLMRVERNHVPYGNYDNYFLHFFLSSQF